MREHLFKGKRTDNGEWVEGYYWTNEVGNHFIKVVRDFDDNFVSNPSKNDFEVDPETLCECVGQPDKNNKLIFENDKLRCAVEEPSTGKIYKYFDCIVKYCKTTNAWGWYGIDERGVLNKIPPQQNYIEVIGNKFDK